VTAPPGPQTPGGAAPPNSVLRKGHASHDNHHRASRTVRRPTGSTRIRATVRSTPSRYPGRRRRRPRPGRDLTCADCCPVPGDGDTRARTDPTPSAPPRRTAAYPRPRSRHHPRRRPAHRSPAALNARPTGQRSARHPPRPTSECQPQRQRRRVNLRSGCKRSRRARPSAQVTPTSCALSRSRASPTPSSRSPRRWPNTPATRRHGRSTSTSPATGTRPGGRSTAGSARRSTTHSPSRPWSRRSYRSSRCRRARSAFAPTTNATGRSSCGSPLRKPSRSALTHRSNADGHDHAAGRRALTAACVDAGRAAPGVVAVSYR
jgi:hypothetical protein